MWIAFWVVYCVLYVPTVHMAFIQCRTEWFEYAMEKTVQLNKGKPVTERQIEEIERQYRRNGRGGDISVAIALAVFSPITFVFFLAHSPYGRDVRSGGASLRRGR